MDPGATLAVLTFLAGIMCILGWLYATAGNPRSWAILKKSLWLFVLPLALTPPFLLSVGMLVAYEEGLKAFASTREQDPKNKFWLVCLFGIWELVLSKTLLNLLHAQSSGTLDRVTVIGFVLLSIIPVIMHAVTAAVYSFWLQGRLWVAFIASWAFHAAYNLSLQYLDASPWAYLALAGFLALLLALLVAPQVRNAGRNLT